MSFFEALARSMGSQGYDEFIHELVGYVNYYIVFLRLTCKEFAEHKRFYEPLHIFTNVVGDGHVHLLQYMQDNGMEPTDQAWYGVPTNTIATLDWCLNNAYLNGRSALNHACSTGNLIVLEECLKRRFKSDDCYQRSRDAATLDMLWKYQVPVETSVHERGFIASFSQEKMLWYYQHSFDKNLCLEHYMETEGKGMDLDRKFMFLGMFMCRLTKIQLIHYVVYAMFRTEFSGDEKFLSIEQCQALPFEFAVCFDYNYCHCQDPNNHEDRKRRK
jgi:hypothetical protein